MKRRQRQNETPASEPAGMVNRLKQATRSKTDAELAKFVGVPRPTVATWKRRGTAPQSALLHVAMKTGTRMEWLITGKGEPKDKSFVLPSIDAELLAIAIHRAECWWRDFDKRNRAATAAELAHVITTFYSNTRASYDNWRRYTGTERPETLAAIRQTYGMPERQNFVGPWGDQADLDATFDETMRLLKSLIG